MAISGVIHLGLGETNVNIRQKVIDSGEVEQNRDIYISGSTTDQLEEIAIDVSELAEVFIVSSQDVTLEANDGTSPAFTLTLKADKPLIWAEGCGQSNPLTADVTAFYVTRGSGASAKIQIRLLGGA